MDIRLFIDNMQVDLNNELQILFNWQESDLSNPTVIKNGYSKTIVLQGTGNNNKIFGHFWNLERYLVHNSGNTRTDFNPSYRVPFTLYYNSSIYEKGYVKLQRVIRNNGVNRYEIGLFGGLGTFLYNLSTDWNTGVKKSLADLDFFGKRKPKIYSIDANIGNTSTTVEDTVANSDTDLSFTINADTILDAWTNISNNNGKWSVINFAPTYNGFPSNIDTDKVLINFNNMSGLETSVTDGTSAFTAHNGYALGKLPSKLTMEETKDYRSYLQTPIVRTKSIIDAICMKENNNGKYDNGYEVVLDEDFFNPSNPYYWDSWITLPKLNLSYTTVGGTEVDLGTVTPSYDYTTSNGRTLAILVDNPVGTTNKIKVSFDLQITVPNATADRLYLAAINRKWSVINALAIQAYASNSLTDSEYIFGSSSIEWLTNKLSNGAIYTCDYAKSNGTFTPKVNNTSNIEDGSFVRVAQNIYRWNRQIVLECDLPENENVIKIDFQLANSKGSVTDRNKLCTSITPVVGQNSLYTWSMQSVTLLNSDMALIKTSTENFYSNQVITKDALLATSYSPAEFIVSFCKMFGLYLHKDIVEDKIYITTRNNFYKRDNIINLEDIIDLSKDLEINPVYVDTNYVSLTNEAEESASIIEYKDKYGKEFGQKVVDTGFEFNADTKELNNGVFKTAVQIKEQSQYFYKNKDGKNPYVYNGFNYTLYQDGQYTGSTKTVDVDKKEISTYFDSFNDNYKYYDVMSKAQFEDKEHKGLPTENVFLFFNGYENVNGMGYYLTDDIQEMSYLNNKPCWLMTNSEKDANGKKIAIAINNLPRFSRYFEGNHWMMYSFDYGSPRELFVPDIQNNDEGNIYHIYFKNYFEDLYDVNTKVVTCYIKADDLTEDTLRNIYWFRNGLWRINKIYDYNPLSPNTTKCEFIKIQDLANFDIEEATKNPWVKIELDKYYIEQTGGTIVGTVRTWDNYGWQIEGIDYNPSTPLSRGIVTVTPETYGQSGNFVLTVPANIRDDREVTIDVTAGDIGSIVSFRQPGVKYSFGISPTEFSGGTLQTSKILNIVNQYYYDWNISSKPSWITVTPSSVNNGQYGETGSTACTLTMSKNTTEVERTGIVTISETTYGNTYTFTVKQAGYEFSVSTNSLSFNKNGETKTVTITNPYGYSWIVDSKPDWITTAITGGNLTITAAKNITYDRTGIVVIKDTDFNKTYTISVTQASDYVFSISPTSFNFEQDADTKTLTITNPNKMNWIITNYPDWVTISPTGGTGTSVTVGVIKNTGFERSALAISVTETVTNTKYYFNIAQESGYNFSLWPTSLSFNKSASNKQFNIIDDNGYEWQITNIPDWLSVNVRTGNSTTLITVSATKNVSVERSANLIIKETTWGFDYTLSVTQESGFEFSVSPLSFSFAGEGSTTQLTITNPNGYSWKLEEMPYWISANQTTGNSNATIALTAVANGGAARTGEFIVSETTFGNQITVSVSQASGYTFSVTPSQLYFAVAGEGKTITITNPDNYNWTASSNVNWLTLSQSSGNRSATITVTAGNNSAGAARYGKVTITDTTYNKTYEIDIEQEGFEFFVTPTAFTFNSTGGTQQLSIIDGNDFEWEIISYPSWIVPAFTTGNTSYNVNLTAKDNSGSAARSGVLKVKEKAFNNEFSVNINQESGVYFVVKPVSFSFAGEGSTSQLTIDNPYGYSWVAEEIPYWLTLSATAGTGSETIILTASKNSGAERTGTFMISCDEAGGTDVTVTQDEYVTPLLTPRIISIDADYKEKPDPTPSATTYTITYNMATYNTATSGAPLGYGGQIEVWLGAEGSQQGQAYESHNYIINADEGEMVEQSQSLNATISGSVVTFGCTVDVPSGLTTRIEISYGSYFSGANDTNAFINIPTSAISSSTTGQVNIYFTK